MDVELTFRITFILLWILFLAVSFARHSRQLGSRSIRKRFKEASEWEGKTRVTIRALVAPFWITVVALYIIYPDSIAQFAATLSPWLRWTGAGLAISALPLFAWAVQSLGEQFSPHLLLTREHKLVETGPYRWIRHPMYTAEFLFYIGLSIESANWLVALAMMTGPILLCSRISKEEAMLIEEFGDEYRTYMKRAGRFLPRIRKQN